MSDLSDVVEGSPWAKLTGEPAAMFNYSSQAISHVLPIFNRAAGRDFFPLMKERVFDPIGMENVSWGKTGVGGKIGPFNSFGAFTCSARQHARFCYMSMHCGKWAGKQIVPGDYYDWAWQGTKANPAYGAQWWLAAQHPGAPEDFVQAFGQRHNCGCLGPASTWFSFASATGPSRTPGISRGNWSSGCWLR
ncbi:MAG: hypothetical protein J5I93_14210 [Pirellulaceae bacterium]|nr:hypothetical protein [Pirellulaceae bacterium]